MRGMITLSVVVLALLVIGPFMGAFGTPDPSNSVGLASNQLVTLLQSGTFRVVMLSIVVIYGVVLAVASLQATTENAPETDKTGEPLGTTITLSPEVLDLRKRIDASMTRISRLPDETVPVEAKVDLEQMRSSHIPDLETAHRKARAVYADAGPQATALDTDLAVSLELIASRLDELLDECGREAQSQFATQRRFVELRHPIESDGPLALPQATLVERSQRLKKVDKGGALQ